MGRHDYHPEPIQSLEALTGADAEQPRHAAPPAEIESDAATTAELPVYTVAETSTSEQPAEQPASHPQAGPNYVGHRRNLDKQANPWRWVAAGAAVVALVGGSAVAFGNGWFGNKGATSVETTPSTAPQPSETSTEDKNKGGDVALTLPPEFDKSGKEDLIKDGVWTFMPGTAKNGETLAVTKTGMQLRELADDWTGKPSRYIANPPMNTYGTRLKTNGKDFGLGVHLSDLSATPAVMDFYSEPDILQDESRYYQPKTQVSVTDKGMIVRVWQGNGPNADEKKIIDFKSDIGSLGFTLQQRGDQVVVSAGQREVAFDADMYQSSKEVVFGLDGTFKVDEMAAYPAENGARVEMVNTAETHLAPLADDGLQKLVAGIRPDLQIGIATNMRPLTEYPSIAKAYGGNASVLQPEMDMKPQAIYTGDVNPDGSLNAADFHWEASDAFIKLARDNGRQYSAHTPFFGEALPRGFEQFLSDTIDGKHTKEAFDTFMDAWAKEYFGHFQDARAVDVVNEPLADTGIFDKDGGVTLNNNLLARASKKVAGDQRYYAKKAFEVARKYAGPNTKLYFNENGMESDSDRVDVAIGLADYINAGHDKKVLDGVRSQAHIVDGDMKSLMGNARTDHDKVRAVQDNMSHVFARFARNYLQTEVSEFSIDSDDDHAKQLFAEGFMRAVIASRNTYGIQFWSPTNGPDGFTTSINSPSDGYGLEYGNDGLFNFNDDNNTLSQTAIMRGLKNAVKN
jgi:GH35 family endo-1,4-beta-xylanase